METIKKPEMMAAVANMAATAFASLYFYKRIEELEKQLEETTGKVESLKKQIASITEQGKNATELTDQLSKELRSIKPSQEKATIVLNSVVDALHENGIQIEKRKKKRKPEKEEDDDEDLIDQLSKQTRQKVRS